MRPACATPRPPPNGRASGFTILEVLVAFVVASLLLTMVLRGFSSGLSGLLRVDRFATASLVAQSRLAEAGIVVPVAPGRYAGEERGDTTYYWQVAVTPLDWAYEDELADMGSALYRVDVEVSWRSSGRPQSFGLTTLRLGEEPVQ